MSFSQFCSSRSYEKLFVINLLLNVRCCRRKLPFKKLFITILEECTLKLKIFVKKNRLNITIVIKICYRKTLIHCILLCYYYFSFFMYNYINLSYFDYFLCNLLMFMLIFFICFK